MQFKNAQLSYHNGVGTLAISTYDGGHYSLSVEKPLDSYFRLGGTAIDNILYESCMVLSCGPNLCTCILEDGSVVVAKAFGSFTVGDAAHLIEYYDLDIEGNRSYLAVFPYPIKDPKLLFINLDIIDIYGNVQKRYRISPFFVNLYKVIEDGIS